MGEEDHGTRRQHAAAWIVRKLREADRMRGESTALMEKVKHLEITEQTYYR